MPCCLNWRRGRHHSSFSSAAVPKTWTSFREERDNTPSAGEGCLGSYPIYIIQTRGSFRPLSVCLQLHVATSTSCTVAFVPMSLDPLPQVWRTTVCVRERGMKRLLRLRPCTEEGSCSENRRVYIIHDACGNKPGHVKHSMVFKKNTLFRHYVPPSAPRPAFLRVRANSCAPPGPCRAQERRAPSPKRTRRELNQQQG